MLEPERLLRKIAWLIPPPTQHQQRYSGILAPAAKLRPEVVPEPKAVLRLRHVPQSPIDAPPVLSDLRSRMTWARLLARIYEIDALACPCGGRFKPIAAILNPHVARKILEHLGYNSGSVKLHPPRGPPEV